MILRPILRPIIEGLPHGTFGPTHAILSAIYYKDAARRKQLMPIAVNHKFMVVKNA
jgi:hypothetical protein